MFTQKSQKSPKIFVCEKCDYNTCKSADFEKHKLTRKHTNVDKMFTNVDANATNVVIEGQYECTCGKKYFHRQSLYVHKKTCLLMTNEENKIISNNSNTLIEYLMKENSELKNMILDVCKNINSPITNNNNNNTVNSHNKAFNLQFFLNETCKDAMNINEFIDSIQLQLSDLEKM